MSDDLQTARGDPGEEAAMTATSYCCGISTEPLRYQTIGQALDDAVAAHRDREAVVACHQGLRLTYAELARAVDEVAGNLLALGLEPGDRLGIFAPNCAEWVVVQLATARIGIILVTVNPAYRVTELEYVLNKVGARALVLADRFKSSDYLAMLHDLAPELALCEPGRLRSKTLPHLTHVVHLGDATVPGMYAFSALRRPVGKALQARVTEIALRLQPDDPINIQFTSGTTGFPKGATLTHCNILNNGYFVARAMAFTEADRLCIPVPLYHCFGMVMGVLGCLTHGAAMVFPDEAFEPGRVLATLEAERCTALYGVPTMFIAELNHPDFERFDLGNLRTGIMAGAPCPVETMRQVMGRMHMEQVTIAYGMTETSPVSFQTAVDDPVEKRVSTVGRVHPHVEVKLVDEEGRVVPAGARGELCTRGYSVMLGYWDDPGRTAEAIDRAGWMHTGDLAVLDEDGYCNIVGRVKDMIIRGGENVYPREIEEYLMRHPKVRDVAVFGVPDERFGEQVAAWIQLTAGTRAAPDEIIDFCRGQIAHYKVPRYVHFVDAFPMTVTGKIQKFKMRDVMIDDLGLEQVETA
jgi:fatty-acyl-CoA synthase